MERASVLVGAEKKVIKSHQSQSSVAWNGKKRKMKIRWGFVASLHVFIIEWDILIEQICPARRWSLSGLVSPSDFAIYALSRKTVEVAAGDGKWIAFVRVSFLASHGSSEYFCNRNQFWKQALSFKSSNWSFIRNSRCCWRWKNLFSLWKLSDNVNL